MITRRKARPVQVGKVQVGGDAPVSVQTMTKTHTEDVAATVGQIKELEDLGCQIIRLA
ncbi:MAG: flavodoxin-dependent (E)-4-hydroxy-3-methylbut-2-enyl-diphosphate synthase, partial [Deltaproteobacteria bacterium]|nr:flavodoxin-dependent (E)-4-hydroxy-3-methylbut-2-enyl-diphosphate synthase [Deltaproteobacteria bacterium]